MPGLSIIVPVLDEAAEIGASLDALVPFRKRGVEIIVVDGGSRDGTADLARARADRVLAGPRGRAAQMNIGAAMASGDVFLFLHADTRLPRNADKLVIHGLARSKLVWGRFDVEIDGRHRLLPVVAWTMNLRSRLTGIATGDQAMFVARRAFADAGAFPDIPLMEDVALSKKLKRVSRPLCIAERAKTSGRRWEKNGVMPTILLMWRLRFAFWLGVEPAALARHYGYVPRKK
jgi:rSAM/selenodomain-associated transferase 2